MDCSDGYFQNGVASKDFPPQSYPTSVLRFGPLLVIYLHWLVPHYSSIHFTYFPSDYSKVCGILVSTWNQANMSPITLCLLISHQPVIFLRTLDLFLSPLKRSLSLSLDLPLAWVLSTFSPVSDPPDQTRTLEPLLVYPQEMFLGSHQMSYQVGHLEPLLLSWQIPSLLGAEYVQLPDTSLYFSNLLTLQSISQPEG